MPSFLRSRENCLRSTKKGKGKEEGKIDIMVLRALLGAIVTAGKERGRKGKKGKKGGNFAVSTVIRFSAN